MSFSLYSCRWDDEDESSKEPARPRNKSSNLFACSLCSYLTVRKNNLKRHHIAMHEKPTTLECCGTSFENKASLRAHTRSLHALGFTCPTCNRLFCRRALLRRHMTIHNGMKDYHCHMCPYATSHKSNLERHTLKLHNVVCEAKNFACDLCGFTTNQKRNLERHRSRNHSDETPSEESVTPPPEVVGSGSGTEPEAVGNSDVELRDRNETDAAEALLSIFYKCQTETEVLKEDTSAMNSSSSGVIAWAGSNGDVTMVDDLSQVVRSRHDDRTDFSESSESGSLADPKKTRLCVNPYKCQVCQLLFRFQWDFLSHCQTQHRPGEEPIVDQAFLMSKPENSMIGREFLGKFRKILVSSQ